MNKLDKIYAEEVVIHKQQEEILKKINWEMVILVAMFIMEIPGTIYYIIELLNKTS